MSDLHVRNSALVARCIERLKISEIVAPLCATTVLYVNSELRSTSGRVHRSWRGCTLSLSRLEFFGSVQVPQCQHSKRSRSSLVLRENTIIARTRRRHAAVRRPSSTSQSQQVKTANIEHRLPRVELVLKWAVDKHRLPQCRIKVATTIATHVASRTNTIQ